MKYLSHVFILFLGNLIFSPAFLCAAQDTLQPSISVKAELNNAYITIGDPVEYTVTITHSPKLQVLTVPPMPSDQIFQVKKIDEFRKEDGGMIIEGRKMKLTTFQLGEFVLDPVKIEYRTEAGEIKSITTEKIYLKVKSVAEGKPKTDIRGLKGVMPLTQKILKWVIISAVSSLLLLFGWLIYDRLIRKKGRLAKPKEPELTPEETALFELNHLFDSELIRQGKIKEYFLKLSEILRGYFEKRFSIDAIESTTYEIDYELRRCEVDTKLREKIVDVLQDSDLAKFAKWKPEPQDIVRINKRSKEIIQEAAMRRENQSGIQTP